MTTEEKTDFTDIGHGVSYQFTTNRDGQRDGIIYRHPCTPPNEQGSWVAFRGRNDPNSPAGSGWAVESEDPLTLSPSLLCMTCGHHGFIREGEWVPA